MALSFCFVGLIALVIFACLSALAVALRLLRHRRDSSQDLKGGQSREEPTQDQDFPFNGQVDSENVSLESPKEFFI